MTIEEYKEMIRDYVFITKKEREDLHSDLTKDALFTKAMQFAYMALDSLDSLEEIAQKMIGTVAGIELDKILKKFHNYPWQENVWRDFYMTFNDNDERHCDDSFYNKHFETGREIEASNYDWLNEIMERGVSVKEIVELVPEARFFMDEDTILNELQEVNL